MGDLEPRGMDEPGSGKAKEVQRFLPCLEIKDVDE